MTATITVQGGLTEAPEIRYTNGGVTVAGGTIASTDRYLDKQSQEWKDGAKLYLRWTAWRALADNIAASALEKGAQVTITGKLQTRTFQDREGQQRSSTELEVTDFSVSLRRATVTVTRNTPQGATRSSNPGGTGDWNTANVPEPQAGDWQTDSETPF